MGTFETLKSSTEHWCFNDVDMILIQLFPLIMYPDPCLKCRDGMGVEVFCHEGKTNIKDIYPEMFGVYQIQDEEVNERRHFILRNRERLEEPGDRPGLGHDWALWWANDSWYLGYSKDLREIGGQALCRVDVTCPHRINTTFSHINEWFITSEGNWYKAMDMLCLKLALTPNIGTTKDVKTEVETKLLSFIFVHSFHQFGVLF